MEEKSAHSLGIAVHIAHCYLVPMMSQRLPLADKICSLSLNFIIACVRINSYLVGAVAHYGIQRGWYRFYL
jgi:hypothetical protein